jgi:hypothetical protein
MLLLAVRGLSFIPVADEDLLADSDVVVTGKMVSKATSMATTIYQIDIEEWIKGGPALAHIEIRVAGGYDEETNSTLEIPGAPIFEEDETVLLFLINATSHFVIEHFQQGAFFKIAGSNQSYAFNRATDVFDGDVARSFDEFVQWVKDSLSNKRNLPKKYFIPFVETPQKRFTLMGNPSVRWFSFDSGNTITWKNNGQIGGLGSDFIQNCMNVWNSNPETPIRYLHNGQTGATGGLRRKDGVTAVVFGDPKNEVPGTFSCDKGGVVAVGGWWLQGNGKFKGKTFQKIVEGDVIFQNGVECLLSKDNPVRVMSTFLTHEFGHTLGLGHSCGDGPSGPCKSGTAQANAIMRAVVHMPTPPVALSSDDVAGIKYLYSK